MSNILLTGASGSLGTALTKMLMECGHTLLLACNANPPVTDAENVAIIYGDLTDPKFIEELGRQATLKNISVVINCAGLYCNGPFSEMDFNDFKKIIEVNLLAPVALTKAVWPALAKTKDSLLININSVAGEISSPIEAAYCSSKFGLRGFTVSIKKEAAEAGIKVVDFYPGGFQSEMTKERPNFLSQPTVESVARPIVSLINQRTSNEK